MCGAASDAVSGVLHDVRIQYNAIESGRSMHAHHNRYALHGICCVRYILMVDVDAPEEFFDWLDRVEAKADAGDAASVRVLARVTDALVQLRKLDGPPAEDRPDLKRVRQSKKFPVWRTAHPFDTQIALRLICWFPPGSNSVVVALFAADKARMGDVFYDGVGARADVAIERWLRETAEGEQ